jgi:prephenate dehydrogenase
MSAPDHDAAVAAVSHLPLLTAVALTEAVLGDEARDADAARTLAATGWRDMTRLARGDVEMGAGIVTTNAAPIAARLRALTAALTSWADELERAGGPDPDVVRGRLAAAKAALEAGEG